MSDVAAYATLILIHVYQGKGKGHPPTGRGGPRGTG